MEATYVVAQLASFVADSQRDLNHQGDQEQQVEKIHQFPCRGRDLSWTHHGNDTDNRIAKEPPKRAIRLMQILQHLCQPARSFPGFFPSRNRYNPTWQKQPGNLGVSKIDRKGRPDIARWRQ
jgi:hypothetical protein